MKKHVVIGVCGGIAAYKVLDIISALKKQNIDVSVIMTSHACEFVSPLTFQTISQNRVYTDMFHVTQNWEVEHIELAKKADLMLIAPATANFVAKAAAGIADDMLGTVLLASKAPVVFAPAMNTNMYFNPIFQRNVNTLKEYGYIFINPKEGNLACGDVGTGKLADVSVIADEVMERLAVAGPKTDMQGTGDHSEKDMAGKKILVTAGPTIESIDPVRYITNHSSGKMGFAIAEAAFARGASVTLIAGHVRLDCSQGIRRVDIKSSMDMMDAVKEHFHEADAVIKAAAPADYRPAEISETKIKKREGGLTVKFVRNPDILESLGRIKGDKVLVGFAAETNDIIGYAKDKIVKKNLDFIVANNVAQEGAGFRGDTNIITIIDRDGKIDEYEKMTKSAAADIILDKLKQYI